MRGVNFSLTWTITKEEIMANTLSIADEGAKVAHSRPTTVGIALDERIANCRRMLERACVAKAKADAMGWLELPYADVEQIVCGY